MRMRGIAPTGKEPTDRPAGRLGDISDQLVSIDATLGRIEAMLAQSAAQDALDRRKKRSAARRQQGLTLAFLLATLLLIGLAFDRGIEARAAARSMPDAANGHMVRDI